MSKQTQAVHRPEAIRTVNILGATGSIGQSTCDVIFAHKDRFRVELVTAHSRAEILAKTALRMGASCAVITDEMQLGILQSELEGSGIRCLGGVEALLGELTRPVDFTMASIMGMAGLRPLLVALQHSGTVAIANKEPLVAAGALIKSQAERYGTKMLPVDSEHNAIFQVFADAQRADIARIILTASGGPFRGWDKAALRHVTPEQALKHPNWDMGAKISIDSATLMNKALEVIEAHVLFDMPPEKIDILVHPQSIVHSMVEYADGSVLAQMGASDMRTPIAYALGWPDRLATPGQRLDLQTMSQLTFEPLDSEAFEAPGLAYACLRSGQAACIALNAANEIAVHAFLNRRIHFPAMIDCVKAVLNEATFPALSSLDDILDYDRCARERAEFFISSKSLSKAVSNL